MVLLKSIKQIAAATCLSAAAFAPAHADVITLNFEGILTPAQIEAGKVEVGIEDF